MKTRLSFLLIQVRDHRDAIMRQHECTCLLQQLGIDKHQLEILNVFEQPLTRAALLPHDAVLIGGSGHCSVTSHYDFYPALTDALQFALERAQPVFGLCWGFQFIARAFGGRVEKQLENREVGSYLVHKTPHTAQDPVFSSLPGSFWAQLGHTDFVVDLGPDCLNLAYTEKGPYQALRHKSGPIYGAQFHPELDRAALMHRIDFFRGDYVGQEESLALIENGLQDTPHSNRVLAHFITELVIPYHSRRMTLA